MLQGKVYMLSSPNFPKVYIGSTIQPMNKRLNRHRSRWNTCRSKELYHACPDTVEVRVLENIEVESRKELQHHEVRWLKKYQDKLVNRNMPYRNAKERYHENIDKMREYHRNRYAETTKKNGGSGEYRQLEYYNERKDEILRHSALMNAYRHRRLPLQSTMTKYDISEEEVAAFITAMNDPASQETPAVSV